jgi:hypothetical protein
MILVQREAKVPADFKLGPIEPLVRRPGGSRGTALMPRIEAAARRLLNLINRNRMVPHPTYNLLIGQVTRRKLGLPDVGGATPADAAVAVAHGSSSWGRGLRGLLLLVGSGSFWASCRPERSPAAATWGLPKAKT